MKNIDIIWVAYNEFGWAVIVDDNECKIQYKSINSDWSEKIWTYPHITLAIDNAVKEWASYSKKILSQAYEDNTIIYFNDPITVQSRFWYMDTNRKVIL